MTLNINRILVFIFILFIYICIYLILGIKHLLSNKPSNEETQFSKFSKSCNDPLLFELKMSTYLCILLHYKYNNY